MSLSCHISSTNHSTTSLLLRNSHICLSKNASSLFLRKCNVYDNPSTLSLPPITKASSAILRFRNCKLSHPFATLSSFAEAEGEEEQKEEIINLNGHQHHHHQHATTLKSSGENNDELPGFAQAFNISLRTASAVTICMALVTLTFPFFMTSLGQGLALKTKLLSYATLLFGFYMAWNIGANDVANAMGTSVGSGALTIRQAVLIAAVLEFSGAMLMGTHVTSTMQKGILVANVFQGKNYLLFAGLLSSLAASGTWLQVVQSS